MAGGQRSGRGSPSAGGDKAEGVVVESDTAGTGAAENAVTGEVTEPGNALPEIPDAGDGVDLEPATPTVEYVATKDLVYVRTATSGQHGVPVMPGKDVPTDALPEHVDALVNLGLIVDKRETPVVDGPDPDA